MSAHLKTIVGAFLMFVTASARAGLIVGSFNTNQVLRYDDSGALIGVAASGGGLAGPAGIAFGPDHNLYVASRTNQILRYNGASGAFLNVFTSDAHINFPNQIVFAPNGDLLLANAATDQVLRFSGASGAFLGVFASGGGLDAPAGMTYGSDGNLYVVSLHTLQVLRYNGTTGAFINVFASVSGMASLDQCAFGPDGNLYVTAFGDDSVLRFNGSSGAAMGAFVSTGSGGLDGPQGLVFGAGGNLYVASFQSDRVLRYNASTGAFVSVLTSGGGLDEPFYMVSDIPEPACFLGFVGVVVWLVTARSTRGRMPATA